MTGKPFSLSVRAVVFDAAGRCLLLRRSGHNRSFVGKWEWPGGKVEPGEDFAAAILRETREETSLEIEITGLAGATEFEMSTANVVLLCLEARLIGGTLRLSVEHADFAWVALPEISSMTLPDQLSAFMINYASKKGLQP